MEERDFLLNRDLFVHPEIENNDPFEDDEVLKVLMAQNIAA